MARVRLDLRQLASGGRLHPRLYGRAAFGRLTQPVECYVDTGSPYPILHWTIWRETLDVRATVTFEPSSSTLPMLDLAGRRYSVRWGRLPITQLDWDGGPSLPPVKVMCQLCVQRLDTSAHKPELDTPILGLGGGLFDGRYLVLTPGPAPAAWVQDTPPA